MFTATSSDKLGVRRHRAGDERLGSDIGAATVPLMPVTARAPRRAHGMIRHIRRCSGMRPSGQGWRGIADLDAEIGMVGEETIDSKIKKSCEFGGQIAACGGIIAAPLIQR